METLTLHKDDTADMAPPPNGAYDTDLGDLSVDKTVVTRWQWDKQGDPRAVDPMTSVTTFNIALTGRVTATATGPDGRAQAYVYGSLDRYTGNVPQMGASAGPLPREPEDEDEAVPARTVDVSTDRLTRYYGTPGEAFEQVVPIIQRGSMRAEASGGSSGHATGSATTIVGMVLNP